MSRGRCMYFGPASTLTTYLESVSVACPSAFSPVDFFTGMISIDFSLNEDDEEENDDEEAAGGLGKVHHENDRIAQVERLADQFNDSPFGAARFLKEERDGVVALPIEDNADDDEDENAKPSSATGRCCRSLRSSKAFEPSLKSAGVVPNTFTLLHRNMTSLYKNPGTLLIRIAFGVGLALMFGTMFFEVGMQTDEVALIGRTAVICGGIMFFAFLGVTAIPFIMEERATFVRERSNGMYQTSAYLLAKLFTMLPVTLIITLCGSILIVYLCQLRDFAKIFMTMWAVVFSSESFIQFFGAVFNSYEAGMGVAICVYTLFFLTAGFLVIFDRISWPIRWVGYISPFRYSFHAGMRSEFEGVTSLPDSLVFANGEAVLRFYQIESSESVNNYWGNIGILVSIGAFFAILTYFALEHRSR